MKRFLLLLLFIMTLGASILNAQSIDWPLDILDTARDVNYLSNNEKDLILEINKIRYNPARYAQENMTWMQPYYEGKLLKIPGKDAIPTIEGKEAFLLSMEILAATKPLSTLRPSRGMTKACRLLLYDQSLTGKTGHKGSGNSSPYERMQSFGRFIGKSAENIQYGDCEIHHTVIMMLISDGNKSRSNQQNILDPDFQLIGTAIGTHKVMGTMCVVNFASTYTDKK